MRHPVLTTLLLIAVIAATASGWIKANTTTNGTSAQTTNYITGINARADTAFSNFFVFDLADVTVPIGSASLLLENPVDGFYSLENDVFGRTDTYTYRLASVIERGFPASQLLAENWLVPSTAAATWSQINGPDPVDYGSVEINESSNGTTVEIVLNQRAIDDINAAIGQGAGLSYFALGGNLELPNTRIAYAFANTGFNQFDRTLSLAPVPVPPALLLFMTGLVALWGMQRRGES